MIITVPDQFAVYDLHWIIEKPGISARLAPNDYEITSRIKRATRSQQRKGRKRCIAFINGKPADYVTWDLAFSRTSEKIIERLQRKIQDTEDFLDVEKRWKAITYAPGPNGTQTYVDGVLQQRVVQKP